MVNITKDTFQAVFNNKNKKWGRKHQIYSLNREGLDMMFYLGTSNEQNNYEFMRILHLRFDLSRFTLYHLSRFFLFKSQLEK